MTERVLVIGHGAREHALAHKLSGTSREVFVLGGNAGIVQDFICIELKNFSVMAMVLAAKKVAPDLIVVGPETYLVDGVIDGLRAHGLCAFGPNKGASMLESSKAFTKFICNKAHIPTAKFAEFDDFERASFYVDKYPFEELVIKVNGLCAGKGVTVCHSKDEAKHTLHSLFRDNGFMRLGVQEKTIVIEEYLEGQEVSVFGVAQGTEVALFCPMQDYKRLKDLDFGPNTGGMGAVGPLGADRTQRKEFLEKVKEKIFLPALQSMKKLNRPFSGLLYAGLMLTQDGMNLLEFNVRFGDPETQALLFGTKTDIYSLLYGTAQHHPLDMDFWQTQLLDMEPTISIVLASAGYPFGTSESYLLSLPQKLPDNTMLYYAATNRDNLSNLRSGNGRVVNVVARAATVEAARGLGYELLSKIDFIGKQYRSDIGTNMTNLNFH